MYGSKGTLRCRYCAAAVRDIAERIFLRYAGLADWSRKSDAEDAAAHAFRWAAIFTNYADRQDPERSTCQAPEIPYNAENASETNKGASYMNPLSTVLFALQGAISAIRLVEVFIKSDSVKSTLEDVASAIEAALGALRPHAAVSPRSEIFYSDDELDQKDGGSEKPQQAEQSAGGAA